MCRSRVVRPTWKSTQKSVTGLGVVTHKFIPIHLENTELDRTAGRMLGGKRTGAQRVVGLLELLAWSKVLALGSNTLEVVGVVLEAIVTCRNSPKTPHFKSTRTSSLSGWY